MNFRIDGKAFFLTYPQCDLPRHDALDLLSKKLAGHTIIYYAIAQEQHEDGNNHLHCLIILDRRKNVVNGKYFDIGGYHGNYQACRKRQHVFDYVTKSDGNCLTNMDAESLKPSSKSTRNEIGKRLMAGDTLQTLVEEYPQLLFGYLKLQADVKAFESDKVVPRALAPFLANPWGFLISTVSTQKRRNWWIYSTVPNRGKTTWAKAMVKEFGAYIKSSDFAYWNITGRESLLILDDYNTAGLKFNTLNQLCDNTYEARVFQGGIKRMDQLRCVIVLSNVPIIQLYPYMHSTLEARFIEKCID